MSTDSATSLPHRQSTTRTAENPIAQLLSRYRYGMIGALCVLAALVVYVFFASMGTWTRWPETSHYYDDLGAAFRAGRLDLNITAPSALLDLPDPYAPALRNTDPALHSFVDTVWDLTFYGGKFYPYWGPAPGLILAFIKLFYYRPIADQYLVFASQAGLLVFSTALILRVRRTFYSDVPVVLTAVAILTAALVYPIPWMLSHAAIYEASIAANQFFFVGGIYFAYRTLEGENPSAFQLLVAALFWTMAFASRLVALFAVAFLAALTLLWVLRHTAAAARLRTLPKALAALALPPLAGLAGLAYYNWARFGSVFETGMRYTLTSVNLGQLYSQTFRLLYALPNLRLYLLGPMIVKSEYPFVAPKLIPASALLPLPNIGIYHVEQMTGLLYAIPFICFSLLAVVETNRWGARTVLTRSRPADRPRFTALSWLVVGLVGSSLLSFAALLTYFYVAIRFLADVVPSLALLSVIGLWQGYRYVRGSIFGRRLYILGAMALSLLSIAISLFLTMAESYPQFQSHNPQLMKLILALFAH